MPPALLPHIGAEALGSSPCVKQRDEQWRFSTSKQEGLGSQTSWSQLMMTVARIGQILRTRTVRLPDSTMSVFNTKTTSRQQDNWEWHGVGDTEHPHKCSKYFTPILIVVVEHILPRNAIRVVAGTSKSYRLYTWHWQMTHSEKSGQKRSEAWPSRMSESVMTSLKCHNWCGVLCGQNLNVHSVDDSVLYIEHERNTKEIIFKKQKKELFNGINSRIQLVGIIGFRTTRNGGQGDPGRNRKTTRKLEESCGRYRISSTSLVVRTFLSFLFEARTFRANLVFKWICSSTHHDVSWMSPITMCFIAKLLQLSKSFIWVMHAELIAKLLRLS